MSASASTAHRRLGRGLLITLGVIWGLVLLCVALLVGLLVFVSLTSNDLDWKGPNAHSPVWSPDGTTIAYVRSKDATTDLQTDVWIVDLESGRTRNVTRGRGSEWGPAFSPDGTRLIVSSDRDRHKSYLRVTSDYVSVDLVPELYVINLRTGRTRRLTHDVPGRPRADDHAVWSPDGAYVAWERAYNTIWIMRANGAEKRPVYGGKLDPADGTYFPPWDLEWSADGDSILFTSDKGPLSDDLARYRLELAPTGAARPARQRLTEGGDRFGTAQREVYSRVNKTSVEICYTESDCLYNGHLVVIDERGKRRLMRSDYDEAEPAWSPSGETIAFARGWPYKERYRIYVVSPTGFSLRPVTP